jgi:hypothetical protein
MTAGILEPANGVEMDTNWLTASEESHTEPHPGGNHER